MSETQRNALFGVISTHLGFTSPHQVAQNPIDATVVDLGETLVSSGAISPERKALVDRMVDEALTAHGGDFDATLDTFGGVDTLVSSFGPAAAGFEDTLALASMQDTGAFEEEIFSITQEHVGRYATEEDATASSSEAGRELGRGGIGRVMIALDRHLGRDVAIKELLPGKDVQLDASTRSLSTPIVRFLREARITGQLEHPNIVPVYELGKRRDGTLYYTMKIVRGHTLKDALLECETLQDRLKLLPVFIKVCQAIAYAHAKGVVHRDLKPGNVMLGEFGETIVLDWGLAKAHGTRDIHEADLERDLEDLKQVDAGASLDETRDGQMIGTPLYMSPEQAHGKVREIDAASDIWSLGAILYEILTGHQAFRAENIFQVVIAVTSAKYTPVLEVCPEVSPELAAIVDATLQKDKSARYASAAQLADDVEAFLTGGRVRAYSYSAREIIARWAQKHRALLAVSGLALVALIALGVSSYITIRAERDRAQAAELEARDALAEAQRAEAAATAARSQAEELIHFMLGDLRKKLEPVGQLDLLDSVIGAVQGYYAKSASNSPLARHQQARALNLLAQVMGSRGDYAQAEAAFAQATATHRELLEREPNNTTFLDGLGEDLYERSALLLQRGLTEEAQTPLGEALAVEERLHAIDPNKGAWLLDLSKVHMKLAYLAIAQGDLPRAAEQITTALGQRKRLNTLDPEELEWLSYTASSHEALGDVFLEQGKLTEANQAFADALEVRERLELLQPDHADWIFATSTLHESVGRVRELERDFPAALTSYQTSVELLQSLILRDPSNTEWGFNLAKRFQSVGGVHELLQQPESARGLYLESQRRIRNLLLLDPTNLAWKRELAVTHNLLGDLALNASDFESAQSAYAASLEIIEAAAEQQPDNAELQRDKVVGYNKLGDTLRALEQPNAALDAFTRALEMSEKLANQDPSNAAWQRDLAVSHSRIAATHETLKNTPQAVASYQKAIDVLEKLSASDPANAQVKADLETAREHLANFSTPTAIREKKRKTITQKNKPKKRKKKIKQSNKRKKGDGLNKGDTFDF